MGKKKLAEIKAEVAMLLKRLPQGWLAKEIKTAKREPNRNVVVLEMLCAALEKAASSPPKPKARRPAKR